MTWILKEIFCVDLDALQSRLSTLENKNEEFASIIQEKKNRILLLDKDLLNRINESEVFQSKNAGLIKQLATLEDKIRLQEEDYCSKIKDIKQIMYNKDAELEQLKEHLADREATIAQLVQQKENLNNSISILELNKKELLSNIESLKNQQSNNASVSKHAETQQERKEKSSKIDNDEDNILQDEIENNKRQYQNLQKKYDLLQKETEKYKGELSNSKTKINILEKQKSEQDELINQLKRKGQPEHNEVPQDIEEGYKVRFSTINYLEDVVANKPQETTNIKSKRAIDTVIDVEEGKEVYAKEFFKLPESVIFKTRSELEKAIYLHKPKFVCKYCGQLVKISGRKYERGIARFFSHLRDSDDCDYKTTTGKTKREIDRKKFARCNEGERHKNLKLDICNLLQQTPGVTEATIETTLKGNHPILRWRRPDVLAHYQGHDIVFELQLSTTFVSVITERDLFYRLNKTHIIWIFNFDENSQYVDLTNMMTKDIYYNNKMNIFLFDKEAKQKSEEAGELILKCNWITPTGRWKYDNDSISGKIGGAYIRLSDLKFDSTYKPFYVDAESHFLCAHPEIQYEVIHVEQENKLVIEELNKIWEQEEANKLTETQNIEDQKERIIIEYEIESVIRETQKYLIGLREGQIGLITLDGTIRFPFLYDEIKVHRGWVECKRNGLIEIYDSNFNIKGTGISRIEKLDENRKKYVKDYLWGVMDSTATILSKALYSNIEIWTTDKLIAIHNGLYCILGPNGRPLIYEYDYIGQLNSNNIAEVIKAGRKGFISDTCTPTMNKVQDLLEGYKKMNIMGKWGIEDPSGNHLIPCEYDEIGSLGKVLIALQGIELSLIEIKEEINCPVHASFVTRNTRKMLIFKIGEREAFMNLRQQQKALKSGLVPEKMTEMYISHVNKEKGLIYLSPHQIKAYREVIDADYPLGVNIEGRISAILHSGIILENPNNNTGIYIHYKALKGHSIKDYKKGQLIRVQKIGFDTFYKKHLWKIIEIKAI